MNNFDMFMARVSYFYNFVRSHTATRAVVPCLFSNNYKRR